MALAAKRPDLPEPAWTKIKGESGKAFEAFALYRDLGTSRSLTAVAAELSKSRTLLGRWSQTYRWVERVNLYDEMVDARMIEERLSERERQTRQERDLARVGIVAVSRRMAGFGAPGSPDRIEPLSANEIETWAEAATALEKFIRLRRISDGQPTDLIAGALLLSREEGKQLVRLIVDTLLPFIEVERRDAAVLAVSSIDTN